MVKQYIVCIQLLKNQLIGFTIRCLEIRNSNPFEMLLDHISIRSRPTMQIRRFRRSSQGIVARASRLAESSLRFGRIMVARLCRSLLQRHLHQSFHRYSLVAGKNHLLDIVIIPNGNHTLPILQRQAVIRLQGYLNLIQSNRTEIHRIVAGNIRQNLMLCSGIQSHFIKPITIVTSSTIHDTTALGIQHIFTAAAVELIIRLSNICYLLAIRQQAVFKLAVMAT